MKQTLQGIQKGGSFESKYGDVNFLTSTTVILYKNATSGATVVLDVKTVRSFSSC